MINRKLDEISSVDLNFFESNLLIAFSFQLARRKTPIDFHPRNMQDLLMKEMIYHGLKARPRVVAGLALQRTGNKKLINGEQLTETGVARKGLHGRKLLITLIETVGQLSVLKLIV